MIKLNAAIEKYGKNGEKTGWTFIYIASDVAANISSGKKTSFRVKGKIDAVSINQLALIPVGAGDFILPLNADLRKRLKKSKGENVYLELQADESALNLDHDLLECLEAEPTSMGFFKSLTPGHQRYFSKWIESARTIETKSKRIAQALEGFRLKMGYPEMIRYFKERKDA